MHFIFSEIAPVAIGDLQGCGDALSRLLSQIDTHGTPSLWFTGDLVNRGPSSAATLRSVKQLGPRVTAVLGNHDIHLLAVAAGAHSLKAGDTLDDVLNAADCESLLDWLRHLPLAHFDGARLLVHAGVLPQWDVATILALAVEVETQLQASSWRQFLVNVFAAPSVPWNDSLRGAPRARAILDVFTRIRFCTLKGETEFKHSGPPATAPRGFLPWFDVPDRKTAKDIVVFGHWAALGLLLRDNLCGLDTGCVWGKQLTAVQVDIDPAKRYRAIVDCADCAQHLRRV